MTLQPSFIGPVGPVAPAPISRAYQPSPSPITFRTEGGDSRDLMKVLEPWIKELKAIEKRDAQQPPQYQVVESAVQPILGVPVSGHDLCAAGTQAVWRGAGATQQEAMGLTQSGPTVTTQPIQGSLGPLQGANGIKMSCDASGVFDTITIDEKSPVSSTFYDRITNFSITRPQTLAATGTSVFGRAWSIASWPARALFGAVFGTNYTVKVTNTSGLFDPTTPGTTIGTATVPQPPGVVGYASGEASVFPTVGTPGLDEMDLDATGALLQTTGIASGPQIGPVVASSTKVPAAATCTVLMTAGVAGSSPAYYGVQLGVPPKMVYNISLGVEPSNVGFPEGVHCGTADPDRFCYARESYISASNTYAIKYGCLSAATGVPIIPERTAATFPPSSTQPDPQMGCFDDGTMIISFLNQTRMPNFFTVTLVNASTGTPVTLQVSVAGVGPISIPITPGIISFSNNTVTLEFTNFNGFNVTYTINGSQVPLFTNFTAGEIYNMSISAGTATPGSAPQLEGCPSDGQCTPSTATSFLQAADDVSKVPWEYILGGVLGALALVGAGAVTVYCVKVKKYRERNNEKEKSSAVIMQRTAVQREQFEKKMRPGGTASRAPLAHSYAAQRAQNPEVDALKQLAALDINKD